MNFSSVARDLVLILNQGPMRRSHAVKLTSHDLVARLEGIGAIERFGSPMMLRLGLTPIPMVPKASEPKLRTGRKTPLLDAIMAAIGDSEVTLGHISRSISRLPKEISGKLLKLCSSGVLVRRRQHGEIDGKTQKREYYLYRRA